MRRLISILLISLLFALCSLSAAMTESAAESDLIGTWQFVGGGFCQKYDEDAIRAEIEARIQNGTATEFDALVLDYITDDLGPVLAENLHLRSVDAVVDWYSLRFRDRR